MSDRPNKVKLVGTYGGDLTHSQAAWCSTGGETEAKRERVPALLKMLAENGHVTPFERSLLHFSVTCETASHIHLLKHRTFSINGESARYKEYTEDKYYVPSDWDEDSGKELEDACGRAYKDYHFELTTANAERLGRKRAKETARYFLPYAIQVNLDFSCNFRAFVHFQKLRNSEHAQKEIREIAQEMLLAVREETNGDFTHSLLAWEL